MEEKLRAFWAFELPATVMQHLVNFQAVLDVHCPSLKIVKQENLHLTLHFLGDISRRKLAQMVEVFHQIVEEKEAIPFTLGEPGAFPNWQRARVIWVSLQGDREALNLLYNQTGSAIRGLGHPLENKDFLPHITLARATRDQNLDLRKCGQILRTTSLSSSGFLLDHLTLFTSRLTPQGPIYSTFARLPLKKPN